MTHDDMPVPEDDAVAGAARRALQRLAGDGAPGAGSWDTVQTGARRVRQRRFAAVATACAIVLAAAGGAAAVVGSGKAAPSTHTAGRASTTTTTTETSTSVPSATSTPTSLPAPGSKPGPPLGPGVSVTTVPAATPAQATDFAGTISLASNLVVADDPAGVLLTLRNVSNHPVSLLDLPSGVVGVGVWIDDVDWASVDVFDHPDQATFDPGQQRTFGLTINPRPETIGVQQASAAFLTSHNPMMFDEDPAPLISAVPPVSITVVPPDYVAGQPIDPALGSWSATMSAGTAQLQSGDSVLLQATLTNTGAIPQLTESYSSLAIVCSRAGQIVFGQFAGATTVQPGAEQTFSINFTPTDSAVGDLSCAVGIAFHGDPYQAVPHAGLTSDAVAITVLAPPPTTTTTVPGTTTSTTTP